MRRADDVRESTSLPVAPAAAEFVWRLTLKVPPRQLDAVDWGRPLRSGGPAGISRHQLSTPIGLLDLLCTDASTNDFVVVELKRGHSADRVVGQVARYMGWVRTHLAITGQGVEGIVVAREHDDRLRYAAAAVPGLTILTHNVTFHSHPCRTWQASRATTSECSPAAVSG